MATLKSRWESGPQLNGHYLVADLGAQQMIGAIQLALGPFMADYPRDLQIAVSDDGIDWRLKWRGPTAARAIAAAIRSPVSVEIDIPCDRCQGRFVRLSQRGQGPCLLLVDRGVADSRRRRRRDAEDNRELKPENCRAPGPAVIPKGRTPRSPGPKRPQHTAGQQPCRSSAKPSSPDWPESGHSGAPACASSAAKAPLSSPKNTRSPSVESTPEYVCAFPVCA